MSVTRRGTRGFWGPPFWWNGLFLDLGAGSTHGSMQGKPTKPSAYIVCTFLCVHISVKRHKTIRCTYIRTDINQGGVGATRSGCGELRCRGEIKQKCNAGFARTGSNRIFRTERRD